MDSKIVGNICDIVDLTKLKESFDLAVASGASVKKHGRPENWLAQALESTMSEEVENPWYGYIKRLDDAKYDFGGAHWYMFYHGIHFPDEVHNKICDYLNVDATWTVGHMVPPGGTVPLHIDNNDYSPEFKNNLVRYIFQFGPIKQGQVLVLGNDSFHMVNEGDVIQWSDAEAWHGAANFGFETAYYYSIEGTPR